MEFGRAHFAEHAFDAMPMDEIAARAGVSKGLLYHYFGGRRGFYVATIEAVANEVIEATDPIPGVAFELGFVTMLQRFVGYVRDHGAIYRALVRGGLGSDPEVGAILDRVRRVSCQRILAQLGVEESTPAMRIALVGWVAFTETACAEWLDEAEMGEGELVSLLVQALGPMRQLLDDSPM
jgi:AcrR family transcriptional regulator